MVRIICEGKTDKKIILGLLSHLGIEDNAGDFGGYNNCYTEIKMIKFFLLDFWNILLIYNFQLYRLFFHVGWAASFCCPPCEILINLRFFYFVKQKKLDSRVIVYG